MALYIPSSMSFLAAASNNMTLLINFTLFLFSLLLFCASFWAVFSLLLPANSLSFCDHFFICCIRLLRASFKRSWVDSFSIYAISAISSLCSILNEEYSLGRFEKKNPRLFCRYLWNALVSSWNVTDSSYHNKLRIKVMNKKFFFIIYRNIYTNINGSYNFFIFDLFITKNVKEWHLIFLWLHCYLH